MIKENISKTIEAVVSWSDSIAENELELQILLKSAILSIRILNIIIYCLFDPQFTFSSVGSQLEKWLLKHIVFTEIHWLPL